MITFVAEHWLDITTTILGLAYILLEYKASAWMWAVGFVMQALGIVLYYDKGLYADCGMEFYYLSMTAYGYWKWIRGSAKKEPLPITFFPKRLILPWLVIIAAVWGVIYWLLVTFTNSNVPLADKYLEQWFIWIAVDVVTCVLYFYKDIPFKASLYGLYVVIAVMGYLKWRKMVVKD